jgi:hypothetical protein
LIDFSPLDAGFCDNSLVCILSSPRGAAQPVFTF